MIPHEALPVDPQAWASFAIAALLIELTPGPNMAYLAALSMAQGRLAGLRAVAGITLGLSAYMLATVAGLMGVIAQLPWVGEALRWAGFLLLVWMAVEAWRTAPETAPARAATPDDSPFWRGLAVNLLNPKAAIFYLALLPAYIWTDHAPFAVQATVLGATHVAISVIVHLAIVLAAAQATRNLGGPRMTRIRQALAVGIGLAAVWLFWETRQ